MAKSSKSKVLDRTDREILRRLQADGRLSNVDLAKAVNLSPTPCLERVRRLEADGYINGYMALLNPEMLDVGVVSFVQVLLDHTTEDVFERFKAEVLRFPEIVECHMVAGGFDYLLKVRTRDMTDYRLFLGSKLAGIPGVSQTHTYVVMEEVKTGQALVVDEPDPADAPVARSRAARPKTSESPTSPSEAKSEAKSVLREKPEKSGKSGKSMADETDPSPSSSPSPSPSAAQRVAELKAEHLEKGKKAVQPAELNGPAPEKATLPKFLRGRRRHFGP